MTKRIAVIGGCNIDISATAYSPLIFQDSNPGRMNLSFGGVGRNIAENLSRLGYETSVIAPLGDDAFRRQLEENSRSVGLDLSRCLTVEGAATSSYLCLNHPNGDIALAVSAMDICDYLTPAFLETQLSFLNSCDLVVMDANIPEDSIHYLSANVTTKLCADCVSEKKAVRLKDALRSLYFIKANRSEMEAITNIPLTDVYAIRKAASALLALGVKNMAITLSEDGAFFADGAGSAFMQPMHVRTVNSSGCGDAFFAGALHALLEGRCGTETLRSGLAMASICAGAESAVSPAVTRELLQKTLDNYQGGY